MSDPADASTPSPLTPPPEWQPVLTDNAGPAKRKRWSPRHVTAWLAAGTLVATFLNVAVVFYQWTAMERQAGIMKRQTEAMEEANQLNRESLEHARGVAKSGDISTAESLRLARSANENTRNNFRQDQRPYIWLTRFEAPSLFIHQKRAPLGQVTWTWRFTNYGRSPAYRVRYTHSMEVGEGALSRPRIFDKNLATAAPLPPTKDDFSTSVSQPSLAITAEEFSRLGSIDNTIVVFGRFTYTDAYGAPYETSFCFSRLATGAIMYCPEPHSNEIR